MVDAGVRTATGTPNHVTSDFDDVYERERAGLTRLAFLIVGSTAVAEELVQDAFAVLLVNIDHVENPGGFVRTTLVRRCSTWRRRQRMEAERLQRMDDPPPTGDHVVDETWDALRRLRPDRRAVLVLRYYADLTHEEAAAVLGIKPATARTRAHRGLADLRKELDR
jgi:RNA polymerase sigma factor (sigma-70 family)